MSRTCVAAVPMKERKPTGGRMRKALNTWEKSQVRNKEPGRGVGVVCSGAPLNSRRRLLNGPAREGLFMTRRISMFGSWIFCGWQAGGG